MDKYVAGKLAQKGNSLPEEQQQAKESKERSAKNQNLAYTLKIHTRPLAVPVTYYTPLLASQKKPALLNVFGCPDEIGPLVFSVS